MKNSYLAVIVFIAISYSCKDEYEKANEDIEGVWKLETMQYEDSNKTTKIISDLDITLTFTDDKIVTSEDDSGFQFLENDTVFFKYYVSPNACCFYFDESYFEIKPIAALGTMCYDFTKIDKNTIEFYSKQEYNPITKEQTFNVSFLYTKISDLPK